jgi:predicted NAD/FAD-binding protein
MGKKVAIVGSGCSGIGALWALRSTDHEVHLFEQDSRIGGHTNTVQFEGPDGSKVNVDTGFIVMNTATYRQSLYHSVGLSLLLTSVQPISLLS